MVIKPENVMTHVRRKLTVCARNNIIHTSFYIFNSIIQIQYFMIILSLFHKIETANHFPSKLFKK